MLTFLLAVGSQVSILELAHHWKKQRQVPGISVEVSLSPKSDGSCMWQ